MERVAVIVVMKMKRRARGRYLCVYMHSHREGGGRKGWGGMEVRRGEKNRQNWGNEVECVRVCV